ncbi:glucosamine-6-phosphate deaminase [Microbacterium sp. NPDC086615]|uniref:glucosamine-6-phosphate deaminase n=1 Tax=Microbacterium sp. NPDC086615 TaxID=3154865 RepID=UPI0034483C94
MSAQTLALAPVSPTTRVISCATDEIGEVAADLVATVAPDGVLGVATGSSPLALYAALIRRRERSLSLSNAPDLGPHERSLSLSNAPDLGPHERSLSLSNAPDLGLHERSLSLSKGPAATEGFATEHLRLFALDEYVGLDAADPRSYAAYVRSVIAEPLGIPSQNVRVPSGATAADADAYERAIAEAGGVDLQIVGIGRNGHIGFNEPGSDAETRTRVVALDESTRRANAEHFGGDLSLVPTHAMTQGVATILSARRIVLVASGRAKARALRAALTGPVSADNPASFLQRHPDVTVVADPDALSEDR